MGLLSGLDVESPAWMESKVTLQGADINIPFTELAKSRGVVSLRVKNQQFSECTS